MTAPLPRPPVKVFLVPFLFPSWVVGMVPIAGVILLRRDGEVSASLLAHELMHILQARRSWVPWPLRYFWQWLTTGRSYKNMPYEIEARQASADPTMLAWGREVYSRTFR